MNNYIINFRHTKKDLVISISGENNNVKLWDAENWECLLSLNANKYGIMFSATFLYDNNSGQNFIVTCNCTGSEYIKIYDFFGNKISDVPFRPDINSDNDEDKNNNESNNNN